MLLILGLLTLALAVFGYAAYRYSKTKSAESMWMSLGLGFLTAGMAAATVVPPCCEIPPEPEPEPPPITRDFGGFRPHFQGFGATTRGGRDGKVCVVNTLTIDGSQTFGPQGDLGDCVAQRPECQNTWASCARTVMFNLSGTSDAAALGGQIAINSPYLTIAGQTAPSRTEGSGDSNGAGGFTLIARLLVDTHDVYVGHIRVRKPPQSLNTCSIGEAGDGGDNSHVQNVIFDHVSCSWATNVNNYLQAYPGSGNVMLTDSLIYEGLWEPPWGGIGAGVGGDSTIVRNVFAHHWSRQPIWGSATRIILANNITYNGTDNTPAGETLPAFYGDLDGDGNPGALTQAMILWNVLIKGPDSGNAHAFLGFSKKQASLDAGSKTFLEGNQGPGVTSAFGDGQWAATVCGNYGAQYQSAATCGPGSNVRTDTPFDWWGPMNMATMVENIRDAVLANVGARPTDRDSADTRVLEDIVQGDGTHYLDWAYIQSYGGMPTLAQRSRVVTPPADGPGTCGVYADGSTRSAIDCWLEYDPAFGARRLERWPVTTRRTVRR